MDRFQPCKILLQKGPNHILAVIFTSFDICIYVLLLQGKQLRTVLESNRCLAGFYCCTIRHGFPQFPSGMDPAASALILTLATGIFRWTIVYKARYIVTAPVQCFDSVCLSAAKQQNAFFLQMTAILLSNNSCQAVNTKTEICIAACDVIFMDFCQVYHSVYNEWSCAATPSISTPVGSFSSASRYWISSATGIESYGTSRGPVASATRSHSFRSQ